MYHQMPCGARFWKVLFAIDQDIAETTRSAACPCGGYLHVANYPRKPRGGPEDLPESYRSRLSFCCSRDGCRKRATPPSVRFLGPKLYLGIVVILVTALRQGPTPRGARELGHRFSADRRTIARWQVFWRDQFPETAFWRIERGRVTPTVEITELPRSILLAFLPRGGRQHEAWQRLLKFLSPVTRPGAMAIAAGAGGQASLMGRAHPQRMPVDFSG